VKVQVGTFYKEKELATRRFKNWITLSRPISFSTLLPVASIWFRMVEVLAGGGGYDLVLVTMGQVVTCISTILYMAPYSIWCRMVEVLNVGWRGRIHPSDHASGGDLLASHHLTLSRSI